MTDPFDPSAIARFESAFAKRGDSCWPWLRATDRYGYGKFKVNGRYLKAHRVAWELAHGVPIPSGLVIDHRGRVR